MHDGALHNELAFRLKKLHNVLVCLFDIPSNKVWHFVGEATGLIYWTGWHLICLNNTVCNGDAVIVITKGWRLVDNTSTTVRRDIGVVEDNECFLTELCAE
jgi:hypothetical protein